ncbi:MBL fold metallo-hydrolase [Rhodococcus sp. T2V]|uniref:MBL fold metallo-hydrolase n=1 Tax=Rhodococcus sp. T2V TaxID=3034164 RepID=UPI0023E2BCE5|nr:MBL fold metallo-hydrolase [Rhodococcus sp. T2V]MDF3309692.1 MBL fold metallo-hydrolase [Rhodococcus sp. T2V]
MPWSFLATTTTTSPLALSALCSSILRRSSCRWASERISSTGCTNRIVQLDWRESRTIAGIQLTEAAVRTLPVEEYAEQHPVDFLGLTSKETRAPSIRVTAATPNYATIGETYGPFDVTLMQIGAHGSSWADIHRTPETVAAHRELSGELRIPSHGSTFDLV